MSESDLFEENIARLLQGAEDPPRMDPIARRRVLVNLRRSRKVSRLRPIVALVAALAACAALFIALPYFTGGDEATDASHVNDDAQPQRVELADGTAVILRAGAGFNEVGPRHIRLVRGELLLDVAKADTPFVVETKHGRAHALGTRFSVRASDEESITSVLRGIVRIETERSQETLRAGESGTMNGDAAQRRAARRLSHDLAWARDLLTADPDIPQPVRRGNLVARNPRFGGEWPLPIRAMKVDVYVENGIARTTIDQTFFNHQHQQLEGVYTFPLPHDAAISRLAMYVDGKLMEGGIVERQQARNVYESIVHQRRDPALLEWMQGNAFRIRIFPLPGRREKRIVLSYTQALPELYGDYDIRVPIPEVDLPVGEFEIEVAVADGNRWELTSNSHAIATTLEEGRRLARYSGADEAIGDDLAIRIQRTDAAPPAAELVSTGDHFMIRTRPDLPEVSRHEARRWVVLYDTSASRSPADLKAQSFFLRRFLGAVDENDRASVVAFDSTQRTYADAPERVGDLDVGAITQFVRHEGRHHVGATDLEAAVGVALAQLRGDGDDVPHILVLSDGVTTSGNAIADQIDGRAKVVGVAIGDTTDAPFLRRLADATGGLVLELDRGDDLAWRAIELVSTLDTARLREVEVEVFDAEGVPIPKAQNHVSAASLADGEALVVLGRASGAPPASASVTGTVAGEPWTRTYELVGQSENAEYLPRLWARSEIGALRADGVEANKQAITDLGLEHFLVTPTTSLLVLENEAMYKEFKVTRSGEKGWGRYDAPDTIPVKYEPVRDAGIPSGSHVVRRRYDPQIPTYYGYGPGRGFGLIGGSRGGAIQLGLGLVGTGRGGGGNGEGTIGLGGLGVIGKGSGSGIARNSGILGQLSRNSGHFLASPFGAAFAAGGDADTFRRAQFAKPGSGLAQRGLSEYGYHSGWWGAMHSAGHDITEYLPAMFEDAFDLEREALLAAANTADAGSMTDDARELVEQARASAPIGRFTLADGTDLVLAADGRFAATRKDTLVREEILYDGNDVVAAYPEVELAVRRRVATAAPVLLGQWVPWLLPTSEQLARWYDVTRTGPRQLTMRQGEQRIVIDFNEDGRVATVRRFDGDTAGTTISFAYARGSIDVVVGSETSRILRWGGTAGTVAFSFDPSAWPTVDLPLRPAQDRATEVAAAAEGSSAWRHAVHQHMASLLAKRDQAQLRVALDLLIADAEPLRRGEATLASAATLHLSATALAAIRDDLGSADPVAEFIHGERQGRRRGPATYPPTVFGMLAAYNRANELLRFRKKTASAAVEHFVRDHKHAGLALTLVQLAASHQWDQPRRVAAQWEALADRWPEHRTVALRSAGVALSGAKGGGVAILEKMFTSAIAAGEAPLVDWNVQQILTRASRWKSAISRWERSVVDSGDAERMAGFVLALSPLGEAAATTRVLRKLDATQLEADTAVGVLQSASGLAAEELAQAIADEVLEAHPDSQAAHELAAGLDEKSGRLRDAADHLERALVLSEGAGMTLAQLRALYGRLLGLETKIANATGDDASIERVLDVAAKWRLDDPDNEAIDTTVAKLLFDQGKDTEGLRHLASLVERHPALGSAHASFARALENEALYKGADKAWADAIATEPTNPMHLLGRAQNRLKYDGPAAAKPFLDEVIKGNWQDRFATTVAEARRVLRSMGK